MTRCASRGPSFWATPATTAMQRISDQRLTFRQQTRRAGENEALVSGEVDIVAMDQNGTLKELPPIFGQGQS
jgi:acyl-CoA thioesterase FadM